MPSGREGRGRKEGCSEREGGVAELDGAQESLHVTQPTTTALNSEDRH